MTLKYFTDANSAAGYVNLQKENLIGIQRIYHLMSSELKLVNVLLEQISAEAIRLNLQPEYVYSTFNPEYLSGLIFRDKNLAFVSGKVVMEEAIIIDLLPVFDNHILRNEKSKIKNIETNMNQFYKKMYMHLRAALLIHDEWERIYIDRMDFVRANVYRDQLADEILNTQIKPSRSEGIVMRRFFAASVPTGIYDFIPTLTQGMKRYFVKGRAGTGKSTLMREVQKRAVTMGYDVDIYHCSLDPKSLDMVVIPELNVCIFDSTLPHEYFPTLQTDVIVDTYQFVKAGTDERYADVLEAVEKKYKNQIKSALDAMRDGNIERKKLEVIYELSLMPKKAQIVLDNLLSKI